MRMVWSSFIALATAGTLVGCGGGGGGGGGSGGGGVGGGTAGRDGLVTSTVRTGPANYAAEATRSYGLAQVGALGPYAANRAGAGVTVGVIDTGIDLQHQDFAGAIDPDSTDIISGVNANVDDHGGHGTAVAGVIGARADGFDARGVAPQSTLLAVRADYSCAPNCIFYQSDLTRATNYAVSHGARVLNFSLGGSAVDAGWAAALTNAVTPGVLADGVTFDPAKERVIVAAAGNNGGTNPIDPAAWLASANGQGRGLAVGAVGTDGVTLAPFSNRAGTAKDYFMVAPGVSIVSSANGGGTRTVNGTSFAAPAVSGAAAVVWGASPYLTGKQVVDILLASATDLGAAGVDDTYGHGLLNLNAALQPLGLASIPTGSTVNSGGAALASTTLNLGGAFGDAFSRGGALSQAMFLDSYGRAFNADLSNTVRAQTQTDPLSAWLGPSKSAVTSATLAQGTALTLAAPPVPEPQFAISEQPGETTRAPRFALSTEVDGNYLGLTRGFGLDQTMGLAAAQPQLAGTGMSGNVLASPYLALSEEGTAMSAGRNLADGVSLTLGVSQDGGARTGPGEADSTRTAAVAEATKRFQDGSLLGTQLGSLTEASGPLSSSSEGAFDFDHQADTVFLGFFGATPLNSKITLFGRWGLGMTDGAALRSALVHDATDITSQSFAMGASARDVGMEGDRVTFTASKPLRVSAGSATLAVPVGRTMDGTVLYRDERVRLAPNGSETDFELSWAVPTGDRQQLIFGGLVALEPGHDASAPPAFAGGAKYRLTW